MIGSGIFLLPSALAAFGGISIVGWAFTTAGSLLLSFVFMRLSRRYPRIGGPYVFAREAFGDLAGFIVAYGYWISILCGNAAIAIASVSYLSILFPVITTASHLDTAAALAVLWVLTGINVMGVRVSGRVQVATTVLKVLPLVVIAILGFFSFDPGHFVPFNASGRGPFDAVTATAALTLWAFLGLESATIPADDIRNPGRTIPRATVVGTSVVALVYILSTASVMGILPRDVLARSNAPFADAAAMLFGSAAGYVVGFAGAAACIGALNGWILLQGQMPLAAALDRLFPKMFRSRSGNGTPVRGIVVSSVFVSVLLSMNYAAGFVEKFTFVILLATLATLVPYLLSALAQLKFLIRERKGGGLAGPVAVAALAFAYSAWAVVGLGGYTIFWGLACIATGLPVFLWMRHRKGIVI
jgi:APA family basic amino acid/polyamine antiporter